MRTIAGYAAFLALGDALIRHVPVVGWLVFGGLALLALRRGWSRPENTPFGTAKTLSIVAASLLVLGTQAWGDPEAPGLWALSIIAVFILNLAVVCIDDMRRKNWLNASVGVGLILTLPSPDHIHLLAVPFSAVYYDIGWLWLVAYTAWDWSFAIRRKPALFGPHTALLGTALATDLIFPGLWSQSRAFTLGIHQLLSFSMPEQRWRLQVSVSEPKLRRAARALRWVGLAALLLSQICR